MVSRVLVVGLGSIGKRHLALARSLLPTADIRVLRHQPDSTVPDEANGCFSELGDAVRFGPETA
jgi:hypothetical protein